jgi:hypothetical protein
LLVAADREQERDVDVHAAAGQLLDRQQPSRGARDLDHHVQPGKALPQLGRLSDRRIGVVGEVRRALERDEPVAATALIKGRAQYPSRLAHVVEREREEQLLGAPRGRR